MKMVEGTRRGLARSTGYKGRRVDAAYPTPTYSTETDVPQYVPIAWLMANIKGPRVTAERSRRSASMYHIHISCETTAVKELDLDLLGEPGDLQELTCCRLKLMERQGKMPSHVQDRER